MLAIHCFLFSETMFLNLIHSSLLTHNPHPPLVMSIMVKAGNFINIGALDRRILNLLDWSCKLRDQGRSHRSPFPYLQEILEMMGKPKLSFVHISLFSSVHSIGNS